MTATVAIGSIMWCTVPRKWSGEKYPRIVFGGARLPVWAQCRIQTAAPVRRVAGSAALTVRVRARSGQSARRCGWIPREWARGVRIAG